MEIKDKLLKEFCSSLSLRMHKLLPERTFLYACLTSPEISYCLSVDKIHIDEITINFIPCVLSEDLPSTLDGEWSCMSHTTIDGGGSELLDELMDCYRLYPLSDDDVKRIISCIEMHGM